MPRFQVDDPANQTAPRNDFPDMGVYTALLEDIRDRSHKRRDGTGDITFLDWYFTITGADNAELVGRKVRGSTLAVLKTTGGELDRKFHQWASAILGTELAAGYPLDSDDLIGLTVEVVVEMEPDRNDPDKKWARVTGVSGSDGPAPASQDPWGRGTQAPPF